MSLRTLSDNIDSLTGARVLVRANFDVPIENGLIEDSTRIEDAVPTLKLLRHHQCQITLLSHYDRPDGTPHPDKSLKPIISVLQQLVGEPIAFVEYKPRLADLEFSTAPIQLIENLRFWAEEESNNTVFAQNLSRLGDVYINEAFANCHRNHASMTAITHYMPLSVAGLSLAKEISILDQVTYQPKRPLVVVIGGAKLETKMPLVTSFEGKADSILVGGKIAAEMVRSNLSPNIHVASLNPDGKDITKAASEHFASIIMSAGTVIWNGTLGLFEEPEFKAGTTIVAKAINQTSAFTVIGGGDTEAALTELNLEQGIDYISTAGGAMLTYLTEGSLIALKPLYA